MNNLNSDISKTRLGKAHAWLELLRISNSPTIISNVLVGVALALVLFSFVQVVLLVCAMLLLYWAGMILNDICDKTIDAKNRPSRPLPSGRISKLASAWVVGVCVVAAVGIVFSFSALAAKVTLGLVILTIIYNLWHKSNPVSPLIMGLCRALVYVICAAALSRVLTGNVFIAGLGLLVYTLALTAAAKEVNRGRAPGLIIKILLLIPAIIVATFVGSHITVSLFISLIVCTGWLLWTTANSRVGRGGMVISKLIAGISLYDGVILAASGWIWGMYVAIACFGLTLFLQRYIKGT